MSAGRLWTAGWFVTALLQVLTVLQPSIQSELVLRLGRPYRFRLLPVDPSDPFRGEYVELELRPNRARWHGPASLRGSEQGYAVLSIDTNGFVSVERIQSERPKSDYLSVRLVWEGHPEGPRIRWPWDRWYAPEGLARELERAALARREFTNYAIVRVWRGLGAIEDLIVDGRSARQQARERSRRREPVQNSLPVSQP